MPRFYSPEWIDAFNEAVADLAPAGAETDAAGAGTVGGRARFRVSQVVSGAPDGELRVVLEVTGDRLRLSRRDDAPAGTAGTAGAPGVAGDDDGEPDVTVVLSYGDAAALSRGEADPAQLVGTGRLKVRGNLSLLLAGQALLAAAADRLAPLAASTTY